MCVDPHVSSHGCRDRKDSKNCCLPPAAMLMLGTLTKLLLRFWTFDPFSPRPACACDPALKADAIQAVFSPYPPSPLPPPSLGPALTVLFMPSPADSSSPTTDRLIVAQTNDPNRVVCQEDKRPHDDGLPPGDPAEGGPWREGPGGGRGGVSTAASLCMLVGKHKLVRGKTQEPRSRQEQAAGQRLTPLCVCVCVHRQS